MAASTRRGRRQGDPACCRVMGCRQLCSVGRARSIQHRRRVFCRQTLGAPTLHNISDYEKQTACTPSARSVMDSARAAQLGMENASTTWLLGCCSFFSGSCYVLCCSSIGVTLDFCAPASGSCAACGPACSATRGHSRRSGPRPTCHGRRLLCVCHLPPRARRRIEKCAH